VRVAIHKCDDVGVDDGWKWRDQWTVEVFEPRGGVEQCACVNAGGMANGG
jgi:hypothetical protein